MDIFQRQLKAARENLILGNYEDSILEYKAVLEHVRKLTTSNYGQPWGVQVDPTLKQRWKQVSDTVKVEMSMADETLQLKKNFVDQVENKKQKDDYSSAMSAMAPIEIAPPQHRPVAMRPPL